MPPEAQDVLAGEALRADEAARTAALDTAGSFLLRAPAGSGKTTVLTRRFLALLATVDEPEQVLAITFTRKAAAEMRTRVLEALRRAAAGAATGHLEAPQALAAWQRDQARGWNLLGVPARLRIMTIDALCQSLCAQLPIATRNGLQLEVAPDARPLYAAAAQRLLERALREPELVGAAQLLFARLDNDWARLGELLALMLAQRAHWLPPVLQDDRAAGAAREATGATDLGQRVASSLRALIAGRLDAALAAWPPPLLERGARLAAHAARTLERPFAPGPLRADPADLPRWRALCMLCLTQDGNWRRRWDKNLGFTTGHADEKAAVAEWVAELARVPGSQALIEELLALPDAQIPAEDAQALQALSLLLRQAAAELQLEFAEQGRVDFVAIAGAARAGLTEQGQPTDLALRVGHAIRHLLVDEFQDTSFDQFELLRALTAGWEPGDGRTLFAVGDPMQSIYQFREAEVGLFLSARDEGIGALRPRSLQLRCNFRSAPPLIDWVNTLCARIFPPRDDPRLAAIRYLPALAARGDLAGGVSVHPLPPGDRASVDAAEAASIVELVRARRAQSADQSIAVLVQARAHAVPIAAALQAAGIPVRGVRLEPLLERAVARDLGALARALQHAGDRTAWLALLHGPCCGLGLAQLQELCEGQEATAWELINDAARVARLSGDAAARLARVRAALAPALEGAERALPLWQRLDRAWLRLGGPAACLEERDLADAQEFIQALAADPQAEKLAGDAFDAFADQLYASPPAVAGAVDILTMHGAKGLEWDVVIVPATGRAPRGDREPLLNWLKLPGSGAGTELLLAPISAVGSSGERTLGAYIKLLRSKRAQLERARLLYVAATRARRELHWFGAARVGADGAIVPRAGTPLALLWPSVAAQFGQVPAPPAPGVPAAPGTPAAPLTPREPAAPRAQPFAGWQLPADWAPPALPPAVTTERLQHSLRDTGAQPEYAWVGMAARAVGTIVHAELQRLSQLAPLPAAPDVGAGDYQAWLAELGVEAAEREAAARDVVDALAATLRDPRGRWLLGSTHAAAHSELRLSGIHEGRVVNVIVDRLLVEADGARWIVDYKTSRHEGGELEAFLLQEEERHRPQLQRYAVLARALAPGPVRAALYFPLLGAFREVAV
ncbi:MAG TPA: UvrD-helicase domain-containing protein [Steroidobacteraceae bacterium]|nr:UvrD-helicase domain-containing protein [Steroidobacteraceae bacterium]